MREADPARLVRQGRRLEGVTVAWTVAVAVVAITAGIAASSIALIGLGLESAIEMMAATIVIWHLAGGEADREARALRLIGVTFLAGGVYIFIESIHELTSHRHARPSGAGLAVAAAALLVMPVLAILKQRTGQRLNSHTLIADATETAMTALAAAAALLATGLDTWLGWWWAVPVTGLGIAGLAVMEGAEIWLHRH